MVGRGCIPFSTVMIGIFRSSVWILNSFVNDHVCSSLNMFNSYYEIKHIKTIPPYGNCILVHCVDNINFSSIFYLNYVLYVPDFNLKPYFYLKNLSRFEMFCWSIHFSRNEYQDDGWFGYQREWFEIWNCLFNNNTILIHRFFFHIRNWWRQRYNLLC